MSPLGLYHLNFTALHSRKPLLLGHVGKSVPVICCQPFNSSRNDHSAKNSCVVSMHETGDWIVAV